MKQSTPEPKRFIAVIHPAQTTSEIADSIADLIEVGIVVDEALGDGFQPLADILKIATQEAKVREIINDVPIFVAEFQQLTPKQAMSAIFEVRDRLQKQNPLGKATKWILGSLYLLARGYRISDQAIDEYIYQREGWTSLAKGEFIMPPTPRT